MIKKSRKRAKYVYLNIAGELKQLSIKKMYLISLIVNILRRIPSSVKD